MELTTLNKSIQQKEAFEESLFSSSNAKTLHQSANYLAELNIPTTRNEYWKYTRLMKLSSEKYQFQKAANIDNKLVFSLNEDCHTLYFENGICNLLNSEIVKNKQFTLENISEKCFAYLPSLEIENATHYFNALNSQLATDGFWVHVNEGNIVEKPIFISQIQSGNNSAAMQHNAIVLEKSAQAKIILSAQSFSSCFINNITQIVLKENASLELYIIQHGGNDAFQIESTYVKQEKNSVFKCVTISLQAALTRNNLNVYLADKHTETSLFGAYLSTKGNIDNHTFIDHAHAECNSNETYKGVLSGNATGVFNGKVMVRQDAQKTNAFQSNKSVLLSDDASMYSKPELEIYADDVKCSHGSTTGQLDEESLFYLRSRGIGEKNAAKMLVQAFLHDISSQISIESLRHNTESLIDTQLQKL